jgi:hypothetical protein
MGWPIAKALEKGFGGASLNEPNANRLAHIY